MTAYVARSEDELRKLAMDIVDGRVFTSNAIHPDEFVHVVRMVFMPIALADQEIVDTWRANEVSMFYEYLSEAGERAINGYPMFMSVRVVSRSEHETLRGLVRQYMALKNQFADQGT